MDFAAAGLLDGLEDEKERTARQELLEQLTDAGVPLEELRRAVEENRLALLPVERLLSGELRYSIVELAERSGLAPEVIERQRRAQGLSVPGCDEIAFDDEDLEAARRVASLREAGLSDEGMLEVTRVFGEALSRVASAVRSFIGKELIEPGDTERDVGLRYVEAARSLGPAVGPLLEHMYSLHLRDQLRSDAVGRAEIESGQLADVHDVSVCFADLVGFTKLGEGLPAEELGGVVGRLTEMAADQTQPPVRLVKTIGDAVMLVSPETEPLLDTAIDLVAQADAAGEDFPQLRAGMARGAALNRFGDWFGSTVNVASRVTGIAYPGSVLATEPVYEDAEDGYRWSFAGERRLKGIGHRVELYRARRLEQEDEDD
jgi:adenylate cyclase